MIFKGEELPSLESLTKQIPTKMGIDYFCYINSALHIDAHNEENQFKCLREFITPESREISGKIMILLKSDKVNDPQYFMFDTYTSMLVLNSLVCNQNNLEIESTDATPQHKILMIKALLCANQTLQTDFKVDIKDETDHLLRFCKIAWPNVLLTGNHRVRVDFMLNGYKSINLIDYIEGNDNINAEFRKYFGLKDGENPINFVSAILSQYMSGLAEKENFRLHHAFNDNVEENPIIARYCMNLDEYDIRQFNPDDFKTFREKPIIKLRENRYDIVNWNFVLEKLATGLLFDLFYNTEVESQFKNNLSTFKGKIGYEFYEKFFQRIFTETVVKKKDIFRTDKKSGSEKSDFYFRRHNKIYLIEFKDILLKKHTEYNKVKAEIDGKLNLENKGTGQLCKQIQHLSGNLDYFEENASIKLKQSKVKVYPIIVVTDTAFSVSGITQYLQREFLKRIETFSFPFMVMPLVIVNFDFLLENYDELKKDEIDFPKCIDFFIEKNKKIQKKKKFIHFNSSLRRYNGFCEYAEKLLPVRKRVSFGELENYTAKRMGLTPR